MNRERLKGLSELEIAKLYASSPYYQCDIVKIAFQNNGRTIYNFQKSIYAGKHYKLGMPILVEIVDYKCRKLNANMTYGILFNRIWPYWGHYLRKPEQRKRMIKSLEGMKNTTCLLFEK